MGKYPPPPPPGMLAEIGKKQDDSVREKERKRKGIEENEKYMDRMCVRGGGVNKNKKGVNIQI